MTSFSSFPVGYGGPSSPVVIVVCLLFFFSARSSRCPPGLQLSRSLAQDLSAAWRLPPPFRQAVLPPHPPGLTVLGRPTSRSLFIATYVYVWRICAINNYTSGSKSLPAAARGVTTRSVMHCSRVYKYFKTESLAHDTHESCCLVIATPTKGSLQCHQRYSGWGSTHTTVSIHGNVPKKFQRLEWSWVQKISRTLGSIPIPKSLMISRTGEMESTFQTICAPYYFGMVNYHSIWCGLWRYTNPKE